jgi:hypothetical protein
VLEHDRTFAQQRNRGVELVRSPAQRLELVASRREIGRLGKAART